MSMSLTKLKRAALGSSKSIFRSVPSSFKIFMPAFFAASMVAKRMSESKDAGTVITTSSGILLKSSFALFKTNLSIKELISEGLNLVLAIS